MLDEHGASAGGAELAMARFGFLDESELLLALHHAHAGCRPQRRRVDRSPEPASTRAAMAVRLGRGLSTELQLNRATEAVAVALLTCHRNPPSRVLRPPPSQANYHWYEEEGIASPGPLFLDNDSWGGHDHAQNDREPRG